MQTTSSVVVLEKQKTVESYWREQGAAEPGEILP